MNRNIDNFIEWNNRHIDHQQDILYSQDGVMGCLCASTHGAGPHLTKTVIEVIDMDKKRKYIVRRLMPKECARLQGFPDGWCDDVPGRTDTAEYKMWGNGMALPCLLFVMQSIKKVVNDENKRPD